MTAFPTTRPTTAATAQATAGFRKGVSAPPVDPNARFANFDLATGANDGTTEADAWQTWDAMAANVVAGDRCFVKRTSSRHDPGANKNLTASGSATQPLILEGYNTIIKDGADSGMDNFFQLGPREITFSGDNSIFRYFDISHTAAPLIVSGRQNRLFKCVVENTGTGSSGLAVFVTGNANFFINSIFLSNAGSGSQRVVQLSPDSIIIGCLVRSKGTTTSAAVLIHIPNSFSNCSSAIGCVLQGNGSGNATVGVNFSDTPQGDDRRLVMNCSISDVETGIRFEDMSGSGNGRNMIIGNVIFNANKGMDSNDAVTDANFGVDMLSNANGATIRYENLGDKPLLHDVTLTASPWIDEANQDFRLNSTAGGGADCKDIQEPVDIIIDGTDVNKMDIGAMQDGS